MLVVDTPDGRRFERAVADIDAAAAVVAAAVSDAESASMLAPRPLHLGTTEGDAAIEAERWTPRQRPRAIAGVGVQTAAAITDDRTGWIDAAMYGCGPIGPVCVGIVGRFRTDPDGIERPGSSAQRRGWDLSVSAEVPREVGRWNLRPGLTVGYGRLRSRFDDEEEISGTLRHHLAGPVVGLQLLASVPVDVRTRIDLGLGVDTPPLGDRTVPTHPEGTLADPPRVFARAVVGIRFEL